MSKNLSRPVQLSFWNAGSSGSAEYKARVTQLLPHLPTSQGFGPILPDLFKKPPPSCRFLLPLFKGLKRHRGLVGAFGGSHTSGAPASMACESSAAGRRRCSGRAAVRRRWSTAYDTTKTEDGGSLTSSACEEPQSTQQFSRGGRRDETDLRVLGVVFASFAISLFTRFGGELHPGTL